MISLAAFRDYIKELGIADHYYIGKLDTKQERSIGVYQRPGGMSSIAIGGLACTSYDVKRVSILVHWNQNAKETEEKALELFNKLIETENIQMGDTKVYFFAMQVPEPIDVGLDESGIYERVIQMDIYHERR